MNIWKGIRLLTQSAILSIMLLFSNFSIASELLVILSDDQNTHNEIATYILKDSHQGGKTILYNEFEKPQIEHTENLFVAIGARACDKVLQKKNYQDTLICTLIPAQTYKALLTKHNEIHIDHNNITAVYMDQPIHRQIALARLIAPDAQSIATVFGETSVLHRDNFEKLAENANFITHYAFLDDAQNPVQILTPLIRQANVFLAIPDSASFNRSVSRWALYITLRNKIPLIGFSSSYSEAGATVSIYSTTEQIAIQTLDVINHFLNSQELITPEFPNNFTIDINHSIVRTLRMNLPDSQEIRHQLKEIHK